MNKNRDNGSEVIIKHYSTGKNNDNKVPFVKH